LSVKKRKTRNHGSNSADGSGSSSSKQSRINAAILSGVQNGLRIMGNSGGSSSIHYWELKSKKTLEDLPNCFEDFAKFLLHLFGAGGAVILKNIRNTMIEELEKVVKIPKEIRSDSDCIELVDFAKGN
jgi:hypothetical protein